ncbi:ABC transporter ATP-binding protein [Halothermothrix orenii]|uniref:ABC transporter transmembrane region n=1 Tax=Halothermothrix orenii (strain H 168 / OCM 544 / DSM 9562) TaxID=373903 RepID=B8CZF8_HALOH|nr:ABC transporter ATP-binding protein [Halothermothrix orenii]ACL70677.1 ABC transporter transmembrane region [Halothermothrix orenii H 168]
MKNVKLLWRFMKGNRLTYLGAILSTGLATLFTILNPQILRVTIDSVIGDKPAELPLWVMRFIDGFSFTQKLVGAGLTLLIITVLRGFFLYLKGKWSAVAAENTARNIRNSIYDHLQHLPYGYHVRAETGDLIQRCTSDLETLRRFMAVQLVEIGRALFILGLALPAMIALDTTMTLIAMLIVPVIFVFSVVFFVKVKSAFKKADEAEGRMSTVLQENLTGVRVVRAFGRESFEIEKFDKKIRSIVI